MASVHSAHRNIADMHHPPDSPLAAVEDQVQHSTLLPPEVERETEDQLRMASRHGLQLQNYERANNDSKMTLTMQSFWIVCGSFIARRGYKYSDPVLSLAKPYTDNVFLLKALNPFSILGGFMATVTAAQLPTDIRFYQDTVRAIQDETKARDAVLAARNATLAKYGIGQVAKGL